MRVIYQLSLIFLFLFISSTFAQVRIGVLGGVNSTGVSGDDPPNGNFAADFGYCAGATADFYIVEDIAVNLRPMYSNRSMIIQYDVRYQYDKYDSISIKTDYFEIPINFKVIAKNEMSYVTAGLSIAIPLNSKATNNRNGNEEDLKKRYESYVVSANFGVGIQFFIGRPMMFIELRYSQSLTNLTKIKIREIDINNKLKSNSIQLNTGILFTL
jgi:hypothetical protein